MMSLPIVPLLETTAQEMGDSIRQILDNHSRLAPAFRVRPETRTDMIYEFSPIPDGFFGESGLTETSANHIANIAKLRYDEIENDIASISFVSHYAQVLGSGNAQGTLRNAKPYQRDKIVQMLDKVSECKGFIAFLREAIKARQKLMSELGIFQLPEIRDAVAPEKDNVPTADEIIAGWNTKERERYLSLEARAATYGQFIHPGGALDKAYRDAVEAAGEPTKLAQNGFQGRDTIIITRTVQGGSVGDIRAMMESLQAEHRKSEAELNGLKNNIKKAIDDANEAALAKLKAESAEWQKKMQELRIREQEVIIERKKVLEALRIVIPKRYEKLYESIAKKD